MDNIGITNLRNGQKISARDFRHMMGLEESQPVTNCPRLKMPAKDRKASGPRASEHEEQKRLFAVCKLHEKKYPGLELIYATPNGGERHAAVAAKLKAEGVKAGVPDIFLPVPKGNTHGLYIELKVQGGQVTDKQRRMLAALAAQGYACLVCYGWENAWKEIEAYMRSGTIHLGAL